MTLSGNVVGVVSGGLTLLTAAWLMYLGPWNRANRVFYHFLVFHAFAMAIQTGTSLFLGDGAYGNRLRPYFILPLPFLALYFVAVYPRPRTWFGRSRYGASTLIALVVALELVYFFDHDAFWRPLEQVEVLGWISPWYRGPLYLAYTLIIATYAVVGFILARDAARSPPGAQRSALRLIALAFTTVAAYSGARELLYVLLDLEGLRISSFTEPPALVFVAATAFVLLRHPRGAPWSRRERTTTAIVLAAGPALATVISVLYAIDRDLILPIRGLPVAVSYLVIPVMVTYALVRHHLFDVRVKLRRTVRLSTIATVALGTLIGASLVAREIVGPERAFYVELSAAFLIVLALARVQRVADRLADSVVPVGGAPGALDGKRLEIYRAALQQAVQPDGTVPPGEATLLRSLRRELGITERDHAVLVHAVRVRGPAGRTMLAPGEMVLGKYRIEAKLGEGAHGATFLTRDTVLDRDVVIKAVRPEHASDPDFLREARAIGKVRHPNVVTLYDVEQVGDEAFIVMEHLDGGSLKERAAKGALDQVAFAHVAQGLLAGLQAVHEAGVVHRDVKPSNVLLTRGGDAKLADFGVAHLSGHETTIGGLGGGHAVGSVQYMAPEQAKGKRVTARSDLYSAAATLYEAYTGRPYLEPLPGESAVELQMRAAAARPIEPQGADLDGLAPWFARALHPDPGSRFASALEMREALDAALT